MYTDSQVSSRDYASRTAAFVAIVVIGLTTLALLTPARPGPPRWPADGQAGAWSSEVSPSAPPAPDRVHVADAPRSGRVHWTSDQAWLRVGHETPCPTPAALQDSTLTDDEERQAGTSAAADGMGPRGPALQMAGTPRAAPDATSHDRARSLHAPRAPPAFL